MNELLLLLTAVISAAFVVVGWHLGKERLYTVIIIFLVLIAAVGGKIVTFFGYETNTGNIFYASVFLATYFLIERYGRREGIYSIGIGLVAVLFFSVLVRITIGLDGSGATALLDSALETALAPVPRLTLASLLAYALSQSLNVYLYLYLKRETGGRYLWLRANICNFVAQLLDSVVFFLIAFSGLLSFADVQEVIRTGLMIKVGFMAFAAFFLYLNTKEEEKDGNGSAILTFKF